MGTKCIGKEEEFILLAFVRGQGIGVGNFYDPQLHEMGGYWRGRGITALGFMTRKGVEEGKGLDW